MFKYLIRFISQSLEFSKSEAKGTLALIFVILVTVISSRIYVAYLKKEPTDLNPTQEAALEEWVQEVKAAIHTKKEETSPVLKSERLALKSTDKKEAVAHLPVFSPKKVEVTVKSTELKNLNIASKESLEEIYGIGPTFSDRIIKYRDLLGGFASLDQLREVYGLKEEVIDEMHKHYHIGTPPTSLDINSDSAKVLAKHPYISYDLAWTIINYRKQNGDIHSIEDLQKIKSVNADMLEKLRPYLQ